MPVTIGNAASMAVPDLTNSIPTGAITNIPKRNRSKTTITIIAIIIKIIVQSVPSISIKVLSIMVYIHVLLVVLNVESDGNIIDCLNSILSSLPLDIFFILHY
ncbi:MAG: hypothetical protein P0116_16510 [Candidatus Nitrosocosmicus sp.]|nr:hypothetical protein [Candidatus Nitrosocosmicus sp.]